MSFVDSFRQAVATQYPSQPPAPAPASPSAATFSVTTNRSSRRQTQTKYMYRHSNTPDLSTRRGTRSEKNNTVPYELPEATFNVLGGVKVASGSNQSLTPRVDPVNGARRWTYVSAHGILDACAVLSLHGLATFGVGAGTNSDGSDSDGSARIYATTVAAGTDASVSPGSATNGTFQPRFNPYYFSKFSLREASGYRLTAGLADGAPYTADDPVVNGAFVRFSSGASDTTFKFITNNGAGGGTITDTLVTVAADTLYHVEIWLDSSAAYCRINNGTIFKNTANLPSSSTYLNITHVGLRSVTAGTEYGLKFYKMYVSDK